MTMAMALEQIHKHLVYHHRRQLGRLDAQLFGWPDTWRVIRYSDVNEEAGRADIEALVVRIAGKEAYTAAKNTHLAMDLDCLKRLVFSETLSGDSAFVFVAQSSLFIDEWVAVLETVMKQINLSAFNQDCALFPMKANAASAFADMLTYRLVRELDAELKTYFIRHPYLSSYCV